MKHSGPIHLSAWQWAAASLLTALLLFGLTLLAQYWRRQKRRQSFLNLYEAKMRRAVQEGIDAKAEVKKALFQFEDLQALEPQAYLLLGKEAGALVGQVVADFQSANAAIDSVARQRKSTAVKLQSVMWKEDLRTRIEQYSETLAPFALHEKTLNAIVDGMRSQFFNG